MSMATTREQAASALFAQLQTIARFKVSARRLFEPTQISPALSPALFLAEAGEAYYNASPQNPPRRTLKYIAAIYNNLGGADVTSIPAAVVNDALDALDALLASLATPGTNRVTLGGLVYHVRIEGEIVKAPGETTGFAMALAPIEIVLP
jgi:stage V sporulation protein SpoVS